MAIQTVKTGAAVNDGTGDDARTAFTTINQNFTNKTHAASRLVGTATGDVMGVGAFGLGAKDSFSASNPYNDSTESELSVNRFMSFSNSMGYPKGLNFVGHGYRRNFFGFTAFGQDPVYITLDDSTKAPDQRVINSYSFRTTKNTFVDPNGFIKNASPIVSLYANKIELNDEAKEQSITFEKLGVGDYLVKGSLGFAQEGWYIEMPKDANGNVLVAVIYEQLANNDISVKTYAKKFDEETGDVVANTAKPRDIPTTRWIDLRLQALPQDDVQPLDTDETVNTNAE